MMVPRLKRWRTRSLASPIPAHTDLITHHRNGLICGNREEFERALGTLGDGAGAQAISSNALHMVREERGWPTGADDTCRRSSSVVSIGGRLTAPRAERTDATPADRMHRHDFTTVKGIGRTHRVGHSRHDAPPFRTDRPR
ncbi:MAG: hypothetical protein IPJ33_03930 [Gammaproteobacteria bacterium]|nr:hypothetical protein [Gammaproteobacteria bacterium]